MEKHEIKNLYEGYTDQLYNLDPGQALKYVCYDLSICRNCLFLYGYIVKSFTDAVTKTKKSEGHYQKCRCMEDEDRKNNKPGHSWQGFDYNRAVEFCHCCSRELINCGIKFSSFYCTDCKKMIEKHNNNLKNIQIPYGRHSFMNNLMLEVPYTEEQKKSFETNLTVFFNKGDKVREWQKLCLFENLHDLGFNFKKDIDLPLYDAFVDNLSRSKEELFLNMVSYLTDEEGINDIIQE
jgi:hypothetical protein